MIWTEAYYSVGWGGRDGPVPTNYIENNRVLKRWPSWLPVNFQVFNSTWLHGSEQPNVQALLSACSKSRANTLDRMKTPHFLTGEKILSARPIVTWNPSAIIPMGSLVFGYNINTPTLYTLRDFRVPEDDWENFLRRRSFPNDIDQLATLLTRGRLQSKPGPQHHLISHLRRVRQLAQPRARARSNAVSQGSESNTILADMVITGDNSQS